MDTPDGRKKRLSCMIYSDSKTVKDVLKFLEKNSLAKCQLSAGRE